MQPTQRFSSRVDNYAKYRPGYPEALLEILRVECGLTPHAVVADIGAGTGLLARLFLENGNRLFAVEPNDDMRQAGEHILRDRPNFQSVAGRAEATTLSPSSVDFVVAGQAFHWFEPDATRREFLRILKPGGWVALVWNNRQTDSKPFLVAYEALLNQYAPAYPTIEQRQRDPRRVESFFAPDPVALSRCETYQDFDFRGLTGRLLSSSYVPEPGHPHYEPMMRNLKEMFERHQTAGNVRMHYDPLIYYGRLSPRDS